MLKTMELHHDKHHAAYVKNLNAALEGQDKFREMSVNELLQNLSKLPDGIRTAVRNNGGGHANHSLFWKLLKKNNGRGTVWRLRQKVERRFRFVRSIQNSFSGCGNQAVRFVGWVFLVLDHKDPGKLTIKTMPNQDSVLSEGLTPVLEVMMFGNMLTT